MLYKVVLAFELVDEILSVTIQMKVTEHYFAVLLFIMLYKLVLTFDSVGKILKCDHSSENLCAVLSSGAVYYSVRGGFR